MTAVLNATLPVFALILLGYGCARIRLLGDGATVVLNKFVVFLALPAVLFHAMAKTSAATLLNGHFLAAFGGGMMATFAVSFFASYCLRGSAHRSLSAASLDGLAAAYPNTAFMGIPLCLIAFGPQALPATVIASFLVICVLMAVAITLIELHAQNGGGQGMHKTLGKVGLGLVKNPLITAPVLGVVLALLKIELPAPVDSFTTLLGNAATPCALVTIGLFLAQKQTSGSTPVVARLVVLKLFFQPALTALLVFTLFPLPTLWTHAAILLSALPVGTGPFMLANLYNRDAAVASRAILLTTLGSVVTVSLLLAWMQAR